MPGIVDYYVKSKQYLRGNVVGRFPRDIWVITAIQLVASAGFSICLPFMPLYLYQERGLVMTLVGTLFLVSGIFSSATQMVGGVLSDRIGRRPLLLGASVVRLFLYSGLAGLMAVSAPVWAIIIVFIAGQSAGMMMRPAITAMVADLAPPDRLTETYGMLRVGQNVGWAMGPAVGGYLIMFMPYAWLFGVTALSSVITLGLIFLFLRESHTGSTEHVEYRTMFTAATDRTFLWFTVLCLLVFLVMGQLGSTLSVFTVEKMGLSTAQYGMLLTANGIIVVLFQYPVARWAGQLAKARGLVLGSLLYGIGWLSLSWTGDFSWALVSIAIVTAGEIVFTPLTASTVGQLAPPDQRGRYMGFFGLSQSLSMSLAPLVGGVLLDVFPLQPWFIWGTICTIALVAAAGFIRWGNTRRIREGIS
ncbi:MAG TPA: MFS transporter [Dehalococcoidia bacterium]|nr:MFS transporter [Dehalococcoidia bacterium]